MDIAKAKEFLYVPENEKKFYISKDLWKLIEMSGKRGLKYCIYAILETESGDTLMNMDWSYSNEPIIMDRFIHLNYFLKHYWFKDIIKL